jgi:hypothetical protein
LCASVKSVRLGWFFSIIPHLADPRIEPFGQKIAAQTFGSLATAFARSLERMAFVGSPRNLCMQRLNRFLIDLRGFFATPLKDFRCAVRLRPLPLDMNQWRTMARSTDGFVGCTPYSEANSDTARPLRPQATRGI